MTSAETSPIERHGLGAKYTRLSKTSAHLGPDPLFACRPVRVSVLRVHTFSFLSHQPPFLSSNVSGMGLVMTEKRSARAYKSSVPKMPSTSAEIVRMEMQDRSREMVLSASRSVKEGLWTIARRCNISPGRFREIYYGAAKRIEAWEADQIRALHSQLADIQERKVQLDLEYARVLGRGVPDAAHIRNSDEPRSQETGGLASGANGVVAGDRREVTARAGGNRP